MLLLSIVWETICTSSQQTGEVGTYTSLFSRLNAAFLGVIKGNVGEYSTVTCCVDDDKLDALLKIIANTIYRPLLELAIGETEFICLKAIVFLSAGKLISSYNQLIVTKMKISRTVLL